MLKGRLGLESARIPHVDRHGLLWLGRGQLYVEAGTLRFRTAGYSDLERGDYGLPFQMVSCLLLQPGTSVVANQAINHASSAVEGAALTAVAATGAIPQLGFIHEDSGNAFALDVADLFRDSVLLPVAFGAARKVLREKQGPVERMVRQIAGEIFRREKVVSRMIDRIKELFDADDDRRDT